MQSAAAAAAAYARNFPMKSLADEKIYALCGLPI
jgi:hypothetical protein